MNRQDKDTLCESLNDTLDRFNHKASATEEVIMDEIRNFIDELDESESKN